MGIFQKSDSDNSDNRADKSRQEPSDSDSQGRSDPFAHSLLSLNSFHSAKLFLARFPRKNQKFYVQ